MFLYNTELDENSVISVDYSISKYVVDLLGLVAWLHEDFEAHQPLLLALGLTPITCESYYQPLLQEVRENFPNMQDNSIGNSDKFLIMLLNKITAVIKNSFHVISEYLPAIVESFVTLTNKSLSHPEGIDQKFTKANGEDLKLIKSALEQIKAGGLTPKLIKSAFRVFFKLLFVGTPHEYKIIKCKNRASGGIDTDEEEKSYSNNQNEFHNFRNSLFNPKLWNQGKASLRSRTSSDPTSTECGHCGNKYKTAVLSRIRVATLSCISLLTQSHSKHLVEFYVNIFPSFRNKSLDQELQKPNIFYFLLNESLNKNAKESIYAIASHFLGHSGMEDYIINLADSQNFEKELPNLSPKSLVRLPNNDDFCDYHWDSDSMQNESTKGIRFFSKMHELLGHLLNNETNTHLQQGIMKAMSSLIMKTPYSKINPKVVSNTILQFTSPNSKLRNKPLIKVCLSVKELRYEMNQRFWFLDSTEKHAAIFHSFLTLNEQNIDILSMVGRNYPEVFYRNWEVLRPFLEDAFYSQNHKMFISCMKVMEEWLKNFKKSYMVNGEQASSGRFSDDNKTHISSSSSSVSRVSEEEKVTVETQESDNILEGFDSFLNKSIILFMESKHNECRSIVLNILSSLREDHWDMLTDKNVELIFEAVYSSWKVNELKASCIKFLGYVIYQDRFHQNLVHWEQTIRMLIGFKDENNLQVKRHNSWAIANICCWCSLNDLSIENVAQMLAISLMYSHSNKEKVKSSGIRAIGYIISRWSSHVINDSIKFINSDDGLFKQVFITPNNNSTDEEQPDKLWIDLVLSVLVEKLGDSCSKICWNSCVSIGHILETKTIRELNPKILFSSKSVETLIKILKDRDNFKTRIHATQTLWKFISFEEYGSSFSNVFKQCIRSLKEISTTQNNFPEYRYVESFESSLLSLCLHLMGLVNGNSTAMVKMASFFNEETELIRKSMMIYLKNKLSCHGISSSKGSTSEDKDEVNAEGSRCISVESFILNNSQLKEDLLKVKSFMQILKEYIHSCGSVQVQFSIFQDIANLAETSVEEYASII